MQLLFAFKILFEKINLKVRRRVLLGGVAFMQNQLPSCSVLGPSCSFLHDRFRTSMCHVPQAPRIYPNSFLSLPPGFSSTILLGKAWVPANCCFLPSRQTLGTSAFPYLECSLPLNPPHPSRPISRPTSFGSSLTLPALNPELVNGSHLALSTHGLPLQLSPPLNILTSLLNKRF